MTITFTENYSYPIMANEVFISTSKLRLTCKYKIFHDPRVITTSERASSVAPTVRSHFYTHNPRDQNKKAHSNQRAEKHIHT